MWLGSEWFGAECTLVYTKGDQFSRSHQELTAAGMCDVKLSGAAAVNGQLAARRDKAGITIYPSMKSKPVNW